MIMQITPTLIAQADQSLLTWGDTAPCLKISKHHGVPYADTLMMVDYFLRTANNPHFDNEQYNSDRWADLRAACFGVARRTAYLWAKGDAYERDRQIKINEHNQALMGRKLD